MGSHTGRMARRASAGRAEEGLRGHLQPGEKLLWSGRPPQGLVLRAGDFLLIPFSLLWTAFAAFFTVSAYEAGAPPIFWGVGLFFALVGLYLVVGRFWTDARMRARTFYGVTDQRVLIVGGRGGRRVTSLPLTSLPPLIARTRRSGRGVLQFGNDAYARSRHHERPGTLRWPGPHVPHFELSEGVDEVQRIILQAKPRG
jgi:hypothetical protein